MGIIRINGKRTSVAGKERRKKAMVTNLSPLVHTPLLQPMLNGHSTARQRLNERNNNNPYVPLFYLLCISTYLFTIYIYIYI